MGNLDYKETTALQMTLKLDQWTGNMQIRKPEPPIHWLIAGVMSQRPSPNVSRSAVGKFLDQLKSFYKYYLCVCEPSHPLKKKISWFPAFPVLGGKSVLVQSELEDSGLKSILFSHVVALRVFLGGKMTWGKL